MPVSENCLYLTHPVILW